MSIFEYDQELEEKKLREAEFEAGREEGRAVRALEPAAGNQESRKDAAEVGAATGGPTLALNGHLDAADPWYDAWLASISEA